MEPFAKVCYVLQVLILRNLYMEILSFSSFGYSGEIVKVEADLRRGLPITDIVGLPGSAVKEARDRVRAAIRNSNLDYPQGRILINLSPADQKKDGSAFDLPIAIAILTAKESNSENTEHSSIDNEQIIKEDNIHTNNKMLKKNRLSENFSQRSPSVMIMGELELSGAVRAVHGVLGAISSAVECGIQYFIVPKENEEEASIPNAVKVFGAATLCEAMEFFYNIQFEISKKDSFNSNTCTTSKLPKINSAVNQVFTWSDDNSLSGDEGSDFENIRGQDSLVRALEIAAAGGHNLIAYGPPGCGKTLSLQRFNSLLPDMEPITAVETTRIYSSAGLLEANRGKDVLLKRPPFRMPHPNASMEGMIGGAGKCIPGEVSLAHGGTLFLDEATQFKSTVLQSLRGPLETGCVTLSRAGKSSTFPARFQLLLAINPCPCGNLGAMDKICTCMPNEIERYWRKLTAPLLDRLDIRIAVFPPEPKSLLSPAKYSTKILRESIKNAKMFQLERMRSIFKVLRQEDDLAKSFGDNQIGSFALNFSLQNSKILPQHIRRICTMTDDANRSFANYAETKKLSGRGSHAILRISRTIADIEQVEKIALCHIEEAVNLRQWINYLPDFL